MGTPPQTLFGSHLCLCYSFVCVRVYMGMCVSLYVITRVGLYVYHHDPDTELFWHRKRAPYVSSLHIVVPLPHS